MYSVDDQLIKKPRHHDDEYSINMKGNLRKGCYIKPSKSKSPNRKEIKRIIEGDKKSEGSFRDKKTDLCIFAWVFKETVTNVLDFSHFFL